MNPTPGLYAEVFRQAAFISALVGGFSFTFVAVLITAPKEKRVTDWTIALAAVSAVGLIVSALGWTLGAAAAAVANESNAAGMAGWFRTLHHVMSAAFLTSLFVFVGCVGLSGWIRSRGLGYATTAAAAVGAVLSVWIVVHSVR